MLVDQLKITTADQNRYSVFKKEVKRSHFNKKSSLQSSYLPTLQLIAF